MLKQVLAMGKRWESAESRHATLMTRLVAPIAGILSLPVIKLSILLWSFGVALSKKSQNHWTHGSFSGLGVRHPS